MFLKLRKELERIGREEGKGFFPLKKVLMGFKDSERGFKAYQRFSKVSKDFREFSRI